MASYHDITNFFVADTAEKVDSWSSRCCEDEILRERVQSLFEVDGFGT